MGVHGLQQVVVGGTTIPDIASLSSTTGTETRGAPASGEVHSPIQAIVAQNPTFNFSTFAILTALQTVPPTGVDMTEHNVAMYLQKHAAVGGRASGSTHRQYLIRGGTLVPTQIDAQHQADATVECMGNICWDGNNDPIVPVGDVSLPGMPSTAERFTMGPSKIGGVVIGEKLSVNVSFGFNVVARSSDGNIWPTESSIREGDPTITVRGLNPDYFKASGAIPLLGANCQVDDTIFYLRRYKGGDAAYYPDDEPYHISIAVAGTCFVDQPFNVDGGGESETSLTLKGVRVGSTWPIVLGLGVVIPSL